VLASAPMLTEPLLLIISSPSGAGKTTLTHELLRTFPDFTFSVSHTTRPPRTTEVDGRDYHFVERVRFEEMVNEHAFAEWAEVHGNLYGTSLAEIDRAQRDGKRGIVFDVDYQGARQLKASRATAVGVFILPPSMSELERRLHGRASETAEVITKRYAHALEEIEHYGFFDYLVVNDDLETAFTHLEGIVLAERSRRFRRADLAERLLRSGKL